MGNQNEVQARIKIDSKFIKINNMVWYIYIKSETKKLLLRTCSVQPNIPRL